MLVFVLFLFLMLVCERCFVSETQNDEISMEHNRAAQIQTDILGRSQSRFCSKDKAKVRTMRSRWNITEQHKLRHISSGGASHDFVAKTRRMSDSPLASSTCLSPQRFLRKDRYWLHSNSKHWFTSCLQTT